MAEFFAMGGYAVFVWSAYGVVAVVLAGLTVWTLASLRAAEKDMRDLEAIAPRRRRRREGEKETSDAQS